jgi:hypothetical protein
MDKLNISIVICPLKSQENICEMRKEDKRPWQSLNCIPDASSPHSPFRNNHHYCPSPAQATYAPYRKNYEMESLSSWCSSQGSQRNKTERR